MEMREAPKFDPMNLADENIKKRTRLKMAIIFNISATVVLAGILIVLVNFLSCGHHVRNDWSSSRYYSLDNESIQLLSNLTNRIEITVFFRPNHESFYDIKHLLDEMAYCSEKLQIKYIDPDRQFAQAEEFVSAYNVREANVITVERDGRVRYLKPVDINDYDYESIKPGESPRRTAFRGEQAVCSAILSVINEQQPVVYFLTGHGERRIDDSDIRRGLSRLIREIEREAIQVKSLNLEEFQTVPDDCAALVVIGPSVSVAREELALLDTYLDQGGSLLALLDSGNESGLAPLLQKWGIELGRNIISDPSRTLTGRELFFRDFGNHPVTERLRGMAGIFYLPQSVKLLVPTNRLEGAADKPFGRVLVRSAESGYEQVMMNGEPVRVASESGPKAYSLGVAVEKGVSSEMGVEIRPTRLVVMGDSAFVANGALTGTGLKLFMNSLNWLVQREGHVTIPPKPFHEFSIQLDTRQLIILFVGTTVGMPLLAALVGMIVWGVRKG